jgi:WD40 repeat protein/serine/threonine protein kinase
MGERSIFMAALDIENRTERAAYLDQACGGDVVLRRRVETLLLAHERADSFLAKPAAGPGGTVDEVAVAEGPGTRIGPYKLLQQIGEGGMGIVYMAEQAEPVRRKVAFKIIKPGMDSKQVIARFEAERQALALMDHQNIAKVFDAGTTDTGRPYFVMELVHGAPITQFCDANQLTPRERLELFVPVCQAIQHAHQKGIIHRDIKPSNVLVTLYDDKPVPKVIDFGVAKAIEQRLTDRTLFTQFGALIGTFEYMSPEQAEMNALGVDTRSDVYSLGVLLYELLTGTTPLEHERIREAALSEMVRLIKEEEPPRPSVRLSSSNNLQKIAAARKTEPAKLSKLVRGEIDWIVMKCLEKDRSRRYETANGLARDVERYLHDEAVEACPPSLGYRLRKFARKYRMPVIVAVAFALLLVAGVVVSTWQALRAWQAEGESLAERNLAMTARQDATTKSQEAEAALEQVRKAEAISHRLYYVASMGLVQQAWDNHNILRVRDLLNETASYPERGFEWYYWQRLCRVEHITLAGHPGGVTALAFSPDGQQLVTGVTDGTARIWDSNDGRELLCLRGHASGVTAVAYAPDGQWLVTGSTDGTTRIWDAANGRERLKLQDETTEPILALAVTPDGKRVVTGSDDGSARVWDAVAGRKLRVLRDKNSGPVWAIAVIPDGERVVTGSWDGTVRIWDLASGQELRTLQGHRWPIGAIAVTRDGKRLVTGQYGDGLVKIWDPETGNPILTTQGGHADCLSLAVTPDGQRFVVGSWGGPAVVRDMVSGREILTLLGHKLWVSCVAVSPDGQRIATGSLDGTARIWDTASGRATRTLPEQTGTVGSVAVTRDGRRIVTLAEDGSTRFWDAASRQELLTVKGNTAMARCVAVTPDGQRIVTGGEDGTVRLWDASSGRRLVKLEGHSGPVLAVAVVADGRRIVTGSQDGTARLWDANSGRQLLKFEGHTMSVSTVAAIPDGQWIVTGSQDGTARLWDAATGREIAQFKVPIEGVRLRSLVIAPDGQRIITVDRTARVWDAVSGQELRSLKGPMERASCVTVTPDGQRIVTGSEYGTVSVWDALTGRELLTLKGHTREIDAVAVTADGWRIVTGSADGTVKIWDAATPAQVALWARHDQEAARRQAAWQRPMVGALGFIQDWLILAPLKLEDDETAYISEIAAKGLERQQLKEEAKLAPRAGDRAWVAGREYTWKAYRSADPVLDFNGFAGKKCRNSAAYAVCYVISAAEQHDLRLQVGSDDQAKVYLNGKQVYKYTRGRSLVALDPAGPVSLRQGTNVVIFKVMNQNADWLGCLRFVDREGNPAMGLRVSLTAE